MEQALNTLVSGHPGSHGEYQQGNDKAPEIQLPGVSQRMHAVRGARGARDAVQQQHLVERIDEGMHRLAQHCGGPGDGRGDEFSGGDQHIAGERRPNSRQSAAFGHTAFQLEE
jgi:hypothetical protein